MNNAAAAPQISFIVPVYNAQKYLRPCLDSITCQLDGNELILINDGSTDASGSICDEYAAKYTGIKVMHTENKGASHARNLGTSMARGIYIVFVDSDDYINQDFSEKFVLSGVSADIVFFGMRKYLKNGDFVLMNDGISTQVLRSANAAQVLEHISGCAKFPASPCGKLVRRAFLNAHRIHFAFNRISEDYDWTYQLLLYGKSYDYFDGGLYTYRQLPQSRSAIGNSKSVEDQLAILTSWEKMECEVGFRRPLNAFLAYEYAMILPFYGALPKKEKEKYRHEMHRCAYLLDCGKTGKLKLIRLVTRLVGVELTSYLLYKYIYWRNKRYGKQ